MIEDLLRQQRRLYNAARAMLAEVEISDRETQALTGWTPHCTFVLKQMIAILIVTSRHPAHPPRAKPATDQAERLADG